MANARPGFPRMVRNTPHIWRWRLFWRSGPVATRDWPCAADSPGGNVAPHLTSSRKMGNLTRMAGRQEAGRVIGEQGRDDVREDRDGIQHSSGNRAGGRRVLVVGPFESSTRGTVVYRAPRVGCPMCGAGGMVYRARAARRMDLPDDLSPQACLYRRPGVWRRDRCAFGGRRCRALAGVSINQYWSAAAAAKLRARSIRTQSTWLAPNQKETHQ